VLVPGVSLQRRTQEEVLLGTETRHWLREAHAANAHIASICTGAFLLALHICGMNLVFLWDGHPARPLYYRARR
jgi:putative intracellular protease/amidase